MVGAIVKEGTQHGSRLNMECLKLTDVNKKKKSLFLKITSCDG